MNDQQKAYQPQPSSGPGNDSPGSGQPQQDLNSQPQQANQPGTDLQAAREAVAAAQQSAGATPTPDPQAHTTHTDPQVQSTAGPTAAPAQDSVQTFQVPSMPSDPDPSPTVSQPLQPNPLQEQALEVDSYHNPTPTIQTFNRRGDQKAEEVPLSPQTPSDSDQIPSPRSGELPPSSPQLPSSVMPLVPNSSPVSVISTPGLEPSPATDTLHTSNSSPSSTETIEPSSQLHTDTSAHEGSQPPTGDGVHPPTQITDDSGAQTAVPDALPSLEPVITPPATPTQIPTPEERVGSVNQFNSDGANLDATNRVGDVDSEPSMPHIDNKPAHNPGPSTLSPSTNNIAEDSTRLTPAFSGNTIGIDNQPSLPEQSSELQPAPNKMGHSPQPESVPATGEPLVAEVAQTNNPLVQTPDGGTFQIPASNQTAPSPAPLQPPQSQAPTVLPGASTSHSHNIKEKTGNILSKLKKMNYKPFFSAALVGVVIFGLFNSQVILGQVQYLTTPSGGVEAPAAATALAPAGDEDRIIIPKINVDVPVVFDISTFDEDEVQKGLERGVVHYGNTAMPGENGNSVIVGHSSNNWWDTGEYKFAFILLDKLEAGDQIIIHHEGTRYVYEMKESFIVHPSDISVLEQTEDPLLTLITCTPPGTSWQRLIVQAEQISPDPETNSVVGDRELAPIDNLQSDSNAGFFDFLRNLF